MAVNYEYQVRLKDKDENVEFNSGAVSWTSSANNQYSIKQNIGTSEESITLPSDMTGGQGPGLTWIKNLDATNYVEIGFATTVYPLRLNASDSMLFHMNTSETDLFLKANTAACDVKIVVQER